MSSGRAYHLKAFTVIILVVVILVGDIVSGSIGIGSGPGGGSSCQANLSNIQCSDRIIFHTAAIGNSTANSNLLTSTSWASINNEFMVVTLTSLSGDTVTSIGDSFTDKFTQQFREVFNCFPCVTFEIWTGISSAPTSSPNAIVIQFNNASINSQEEFLVSTYLNAVGVGNSTGTTGIGTSGSFIIGTTRPSSWIVGGMFNAGTAGTQTCSQIAS